MIADLLLTRSAIIKVKLLFNGSILQRMEEHLAKLAPASQ
jgi:hypothetical protein